MLLLVMGKTLPLGIKITLVIIFYKIKKGKYFLFTNLSCLRSVLKTPIAGRGR